MRKLLSVFLAALMILSLVAVYVSAADEPASVALQIAEGKKNVLAGLTAEYVSKSKTGSSAVLTDGLLSVYAKNHYTNFKASGNKDDEECTIEVKVGNETVKYFYTYTFQLAAPASVDSFTAAYCSDEGGCSINNVDTKVTLLVSTDNGASYQVAYENASDSFGANECTVTSAAIGDKVLNYYKGDVTLNKTYTGVTNIIWAARRHRDGTSNNNYAARMSELAVFGPTAVAPDPVPSGSTDPTPATGDNFVALVMVLGAAVLTAGTVLVVRKKED